MKISPHVAATEVARAILCSLSVGSLLLLIVAFGG